MAGSRRPGRHDPRAVRRPDPTLRATRPRRPGRRPKLDARVLDRLYARLQQCRDLCDGRRAAGHVCRPLSSSTVRKVHYIIRGSLDRAVRWQQLGVNRAELVDPPAPAPTEPDPPSPEEAAALLNDAWTDPDWGAAPLADHAVGCPSRGGLRASLGRRRHDPGDPLGARPASPRPGPA